MENILTSWKSLFFPSPAMASVKNEPNPLTKMSFTEDYVSQVPPFYQGSVWFLHGDDHDSDADDWPLCAGTPDDLWKDWDGCAPIAGAMVLGYWSNMGYTNIPDPDVSWAEDMLIDHCHHSMYTDTEGSTSVIYITPGMEWVTDAYYGYNFYPSFTFNPTWAAVVSVITNDRPFVLSMVDNPTYEDHSVCVYGYKDEATDYLRIFNTWDTSTSTYVTWGAWSYCYMHYVYP